MVVYYCNRRMHCCRCMFKAGNSALQHKHPANCTRTNQNNCTACHCMNCTLRHCTNLTTALCFTVRTARFGTASNKHLHCTSRENCTPAVHSVKKHMHCPHQSVLCCSNYSPFQQKILKSSQKFLLPSEQCRPAYYIDCKWTRRCTGLTVIQYLRITDI